MQDESYWSRIASGRITRRRAIFTGAAGLAAAALVGCSGTKKQVTSTSNAGGSGGTNAALLPPGLEAAYPEIAKYHWSKLTRSKNQPKYGGRLKMQLFFDTPTWDPFDPGTAGVLNCPMTLVYNRLLKPDLSLDAAFAGKNNLFELLPTGDLAESWEQPDQSTYIFKIRQNVKFHNVAPVNARQMVADDVLYTYNAYVNEKSVAQATSFRDVDKFEAPDKFTFKITTKKPIAYLINSLCAPLAFVIAKEARSRPDGLKGEPPIGTGPFIVKEHKFRSSLKVDKNPEYFIKGRPYLDGIDQIWLADSSTSTAAYRTGQIDTLSYYSPYTPFEDILKTERWTREGGKTDARVMQQNAGGNLDYLWRVDQPPFNDLRVRKALSMALDRDKLIPAIFGKGYQGMGFPTDWNHKPGKPWPWEKSEFPDTYKYNPDMAKALLSQAGWKADQTIQIMLGSTSGTSEGPTGDSAALVQEAWKKIGVDAQIKVIDSVAFDDLEFNKKFTPTQVLAGANVSGGLDLDDYTYRILRSDQQNNFCRANDPTLDKLLDGQQAEFDRAKRQLLAQQITQRDLEQIYRLWVATNYFWELTRPYVQNWASHDVYMWLNGWGEHEVQEVWLDR